MLDDTRPEETQRASWVSRVPAGALLVTLAALLAALAILCIAVISSARAYVGGESQWSKGQKSATLALLRYAETRNEADWQRYEQAIAIPLGDRRAREELERPAPDLDIVRRGFLAGGNHADDIAGMIRLFRWGRRIPFMDRAITIWAEADGLIEATRKTAESMRSAIQRGADAQTLDALRSQVLELDTRLTPLASRFSSTLGDAARITQWLLSTAVLVVAAALTLLAVTAMRHAERRTAQQEAALRLSEARRTRALIGSSDGFYEWDLPRRQAYFSPRFAQLIGRTPESLDSEVDAMQALLHPDDVARARAALKAHVEHGEPYDVELRMRHADGGWRWMRSRGLLDRGPDGSELRLSGSISDVTERHAAEEALREANERLEARVAERTHELTEANERLREVDRLKSEFLATMSHELRTPLNAILGFSSLMLADRNESLSEHQRRSLGHVNSAGHHLLSLINDLLDLSRIESGRMDCDIEPLDAGALITEVLALLKPAADAKGLRLQGSLQPPLMMHSDRRKLCQVLLNLVNNAVKFTNVGAVEVRAAIVVGELRVEIEDTGIGIAGEQMKNLFQPFRQLDSSLRRVHEGTGLGLYLCRRLLELLGGRIEVSSQPGVGSCFRVTLPVMRDA